MDKKKVAVWFFAPIVLLALSMFSEGTFLKDAARNAINFSGFLFYLVIPYVLHLLIQAANECMVTIGVQRRFSYDNFIMRELYSFSLLSTASIFGAFTFFLVLYGYSAPSIGIFVKTIAALAMCAAYSYFCILCIRAVENDTVAPMTPKIFFLLIPFQNSSLPRIESALRFGVLIMFALTLVYGVLSGWKIPA